MYGRRVVGFDVVVVEQHYFARRRGLFERFDAQVDKRFAGEGHTLTPRNAGHRGGGEICRRAREGAYEAAASEGSLIRWIVQLRSPRLDEWLEDQLTS
ncbi:MAG TPA: hypothetical protein VGB55_10465 [Tepidisphaeraceae bacterium]